MQKLHIDFYAVFAYNVSREVIIVKGKNEIEAFCDNVSYLRQKHKLSYTAMSKKLHITIKTLKQLEQGNMSKKTNVKTIFYICREFNVLPKELFSPLRNK